MSLIPKRFKLKKEDRDRAQLLYFSGREVSEIATILGLEMDALRFHIFGADGTGRDSLSWYSLKQKMQPTVLALFIKDKISVLEQVSGIGVEILSDSLSALRDDVKSKKVKLNAGDIEKLSKVVTGLDKIYRLESGQATDINSFLGLTPEEARKIIQADPFAVSDVKDSEGVIDAEYSEVEPSEVGVPWVGGDDTEGEEEPGEEISQDPHSS